MSSLGEEKATKGGGIFGRFKNATQSFSKIWTKHERTRDPQLESRIEQTEDVRRRYTEINKTLQAIVLQYASLGKSHASLAAQLGELAQREAELQGSLHRTAELHDTLGMRTDPLIVSLKPVTHGLSTLCDKTIGDAMQSVRLWQHARSEFDTFRAELESPGISPTPEQEAHLVELQHRLDKVRENVWVKLDLLQEHRVLVVCGVFQSAIARLHPYRLVELTVDQYMALLYDAFRQFYSLDRGGDVPEAAETVHVPGWSPRPVFNQSSKLGPLPNDQSKNEQGGEAAAKPDGGLADEGVEVNAAETIKAIDAVAVKPDSAPGVAKKRVSFSTGPNTIIDPPSDPVSVSEEDEAME